jgi:hypothetical protein
MLLVLGTAAFDATSSAAPTAQVVISLLILPLLGTLAVGL